MLRFVRLAVVGVLLGGLVAITGQTANAEAECAQLDPWPSFTEAAPTAKTVFVGTVTEIYPGNEARFTFRVDEVLRGNTPAVIELDGFKSAIRLKDICPTGSVLMVRKAGERLAFAMDAKLDGVPGRIDAVAFVGDSKPRRSLLPEMEQLPLTKVRRLAGQAPDGSTSSEPRHAADGPMGRTTLKRVAPGVWRVSDDWSGLDIDRVRLIAAGPDGAAWLAGTRLLTRLGQARTTRKPKSLRYLTDLAIAPDGDLLATGPYPATYDGEAWTKLIGDPEQDPLRTHVTFLSDGTAWAGTDPSRSHENPGFARWDGDSWSIDDHPCDCITTGFAEDATGDLWMGVKGWDEFQGGNGAGLFRLKDGRWNEVRPFSDSEPAEVYGIAGGPDGTVWVSFLPGIAQGSRLGDYTGSVLARWDGEAWTAYEWPSWVRGTLERINPYRGSLGYNKAFSPDMEVGPDGTLWFEQPLMSFDGESWRSYSVPTKDEKGPRTSELAIDPDGMIWLSVRDFTDPVPGRPHRLLVLDPAEAVPALSEDAVVVTPDTEARAE